MARTRDRKDLHLWRDPTYNARDGIPMCSCCGNKPRNWRHGLYPHMCPNCLNTRVRKNEAATQRAALKRVAPIDVSTLTREERDQLLNGLLKIPKKNTQEQRLIADLQALRPVCACGKRKVRLNHEHCDTCIARHKVLGRVLPGRIQTLNVPTIAESAEAFRRSVKK